MTALAFKSETIPPHIPSKQIPISEENNLFDDSLEFTRARIDSFLKIPSVETEMDEASNSDTKISLFSAKQEELIHVLHDSLYRQKTSVSSQKWKGYVTSTSGESFTAIITDISGKNQDEEVEIPLEAISQDDLHLVADGAHFDWHIGYEKLSGTTQKYSKILFRRMPRWTSSDFIRSKALKQNLKKFLLKGPAK